MTSPGQESGERDLTTPPVAPELRRSREDRVFGGVCGGLGRYLGVDPIWLRLAFVVMVLGGGAGLIVYLAALIIIPAAPEGAREYRRAPRRELDATLLLGGGLIVVGVIALAARLIPWLDDFVWPMVLIALGAGLIWRSLDR